MQSISDDEDKDREGTASKPPLWVQAAKQCWRQQPPGGGLVGAVGCPRIPQLLTPPPAPTAPSLLRPRRR